MFLLKNQKGFTITEVMVTFGIIIILLGIATFNLIGSTNKVYESDWSATLISDLKLQQNKAMSGDTQNTSLNSRYGIYFESDKYTLFRGNSYNSSDTSNLVIRIPSSIRLTNILFPQSQVTFEKGSGEIVGFTSGANAVTFTNSNDRIQKTVTINRFGVITSN